VHATIDVIDVELNAVYYRGDQLPDEPFSVFLQVLISQTLQPTFIDELRSQPGMKFHHHHFASLATVCLFSSIVLHHCGVRKGIQSIKLHHNPLFQGSNQPSQVYLEK